MVVLSVCIYKNFFDLAIRDDSLNWDSLHIRNAIQDDNQEMSHNPI